MSEESDWLGDTDLILSGLRDVQTRMQRYFQTNNILEADRDPQDAYVKDFAVREAADGVVQLCQPIVSQALGKNAKYYNGKKSRFSREELETVANVGDIGGVDNAGDEGTETAGRNRYGGLLAAVLLARKNTSIGEFISFAQEKAHGAIQDYVRREAGNVRDRHKDKDRNKEKAKLRRAKPLSSFTTIDDHSYEPTGTYFGAGNDEIILTKIDAEGVRLAADTLPEPHRAVIHELLDSLPEESDHDQIAKIIRDKLYVSCGTVSLPIPEAQPLRTALTELKFAYCRLDDEHLPPELVKAKEKIYESSNDKELADKIVAYRQAAGINGKELADKLGMAKSNVSDCGIKHRIPRGALFVLGIKEKDLPAFAVPCPEVWEERKVAAEKKELPRSTDYDEFANRLGNIFQAELSHHPERMQTCGRSVFKSQGIEQHLSLLRDPTVWNSRSKSKVRNIANVLQISAVTHQMLPVFVRDKLPKELLDMPLAGDAAAGQAAARWQDRPAVAAEKPGMLRGGC